MPRPPPRLPVSALPDARTPFCFHFGKAPNAVTRDASFRSNDACRGARTGREHRKEVGITRFLPNILSGAYPNPYYIADNRFVSVCYTELDQIS
jgi:hypothetical protein